MNNREYDYKELSDQVYNDVRSAISESGQKAIQDGITDIFKTNFKKNKLSLSGFGKQFKNIDKIIKDTLEDAANNKPLVIKPSILIDPQITTLNDRDLLDKIQDLYEESANASTKGEILKYAQNIIYAAKTAQIRGLDKQFPEVKQVLQTFNDPYDVYFGEFFDRIQQEMQQIEKTIVNQYIYKALEEFTKTKLSMSSPDTKKSLQTSQRQISQITTTVEDTAESVNQLEKAFKKTSQQATTATDQMVDGLKEVKTEAKETQEILEQNKKSISTKPTSYTDGDAQDSNIVSVYKNGVRTDYDVNSQRNELIQALRELASTIKNPQAHAGDLTHQINPLSLYRTDNFLKEMSHMTPGLISGLYLSSNFNDVLEFYRKNGDHGKNAANKRRLYSLDVNDYSNLMKFTGDDEWYSFTNMTLDINNIIRQSVLNNTFDKNSIDKVFQKYKYWFDSVNYSLEELYYFINSEIEYLSHFDLKNIEDKLTEDYNLDTNKKDPLKAINSTTNRLLESIFGVADIGIDMTPIAIANSTNSAGAVLPKINKIVNGVDFGNNEDIFIDFYKMVFEKIILSLSNYNTSQTFTTLTEKTSEEIAHLLLKRFGFDEIYNDENYKKELSNQIANKMISDKLIDFETNNFSLIAQTKNKRKYSSVYEQQLDYAKKGDLIDALRIPEMIYRLANFNEDGENNAIDSNGNILYNQNIIAIIRNLIEEEVQQYERKRQSKHQLGRILSGMAQTASGEVFTESSSGSGRIYRGRSDASSDRASEEAFESLNYRIIEETNLLNDQSQAYQELALNVEEYHDVIQQKPLTDEENLDILNQIAEAQQSLLSPSISEPIAKPVQKATESFDEFQNKIKGIKEFAEEYDLFDFKEFDIETLDKLQDTLFALTSEDLKKLGFENTDEILEDLATINERLAEVKWQFENNDFTDEGWVQSDQLDDYVDTSLRSASVLKEIAEVDDTARISVQRLIDTIADYNGQQVDEIIDVEPDELRVIDQTTEAINKEKEASEKASQQFQEEAENRIDLLGLINDINRESQNAPLNLNTQDTIIEEKKLQEQVQKTTETIIKQTEATDKAFESFGAVRVRVDELKRKQAELEEENSNLTDVYKRYQRKQDEYRLLSDEELEAKWQEKLEHKTDYKSLPGSDDFYKKWSSALALVDEIKKRTGETKDLNLLSTSGIMNEVETFANKIRDYADNVDKYDQITNQIISISHEWKALEDTYSSYTSPLDKLEKGLFENIDKIIESRGRIKTSRIDEMLNSLSQIEKIKGSPVSIEEYTQAEKVIGAVNKRFEELQQRKSDLAQSKPVFANDAERAAFAKQEAERLKSQRNAQQAADVEVDSQKEIQSALKETAQVQEQVGQQQQSSTNDNINSYRNLIKTMKEFVDAVTSQRKIAQQTNTDEAAQNNKDLANASEKTATAISLESQSAINAANSLNQLTTAKQINTEQEEKLAQKTLEAASALMIESDAAKDVAKNINNLSRAKLKNVKEKSSNNILNHNKNNDIVSNTDKAKSVDQITEALKELNKTEKDYQILENKRNQKGALTDKENAKYQELLAIRERDNQILSRQTVYTEKQNIAYQEYLETVKKVSAYIKGLNNNDTFILDTQKKLDSLFKQGKHTDEYYNRLKEIQVLLNQMANTTSNVDFMNLKSQVTTYLDDVVKNGDAFKTISEVSRSKLSNRMQEWLESNTKASTKYRKEIERLIKVLKTIDNQSDLKNIETQFLDIKSLNASEGNSGKSFGKRILNRIADQNSKFLAQYFSIQDWIRYIRQMGQTVVEIDSAITELRKVSNASDERLSLSFEKSAQTAKELGDSITNVINVTADWSRLGYDVDAAEELARVTTLFKNVGDNMSAEDASSYLISTLQGFQKDASEAERIIDTYNEVANNFAIDTRGIGEALQRSAASFNAANTDLSGAVAVITAANSVVQNPEQIGTAMKTLSARIRGSKAELEELGEEEENVVELTSKLRNEVKAMTGFDIMENEDTYKSIDEIIIGIGEHWQELTDIQQAALAEDLAGKRNSNVLIALLQNAELVKKVYETAEGAAGSATKEQENYAKSIQYSLDRLKATWQEIQTNLLQSDNVKSLVESAATALNGLGKSAELLAEPLSFVMKLLGGLFELLGKLSEMTNGWGTAGLLGGVIVGLKRKSKNNDLRSILSDDLLKETNSGRNKKPFLIIAGRYSSLSWDTSLNIA